ncbi:MAG: hypothetical protein M1835_001333 [Candelina submexicana]|nr:MAG: hypothetical protein M1835_001333 [Candelina submexicana]
MDKRTAVKPRVTRRVAWRSSKPQQNRGPISKRNDCLNAHPATANNRKQLFPFLKLPGELRNCVYKVFLQDSADTVVTPRYHRGCWSPNHTGQDLLALAMVSHQLHDEVMLLYRDAKLLYYNSHTFVFDSAGMMGLFLNHIGPECKDAIKFVEFVVLNEVRLLDVFEALKECNGLERLKIKISFSGSAHYGENGVLIPPFDRLISNILGPNLPLPHGLRDFSICRSVPEDCLVHPIHVAKILFDGILGDEVKDRIERQRKLRESSSVTAEVSQVFADLDLWS